MMYIVIQPFGDSPTLRGMGTVISRHRTREAAERAIDREIAALKRAHRAYEGSSCWCYLDREIVEEHR